MSDDKLEIEKLFNTKGIDDSIKGDWYIIQWIPDSVARERISIGILFVDKNRLEHTYKFLESGKQISFFNSTFGSKASFYIRKAIDDVKEIIENKKKITYLSIEKEMMNFRVGYGGYASGTSYDEIIERLFNDIVRKPNML